MRQRAEVFPLTLFFDTWYESVSELQQKKRQGGKKQKNIVILLDYPIEGFNYIISV